MTLAKAKVHSLLNPLFSAKYLQFLQPNNILKPNLLSMKRIFSLLLC